MKGHKQVNIPLVDEYLFGSKLNDLHDAVDDIISLAENANIVLDTARLEFDRWGYEGIYLNGWRPFTEREKAAAKRRADAAKKAAATRRAKKEEEERAQLAKLKAKYEDGAK